MVTLGMLLIPIIGAAVLVFIASAIIHMVLPLHKNDFGKLPDEDGVRAAINRNPLAPGEYAIPYCSDMKQMGSAEMVAKYNQGPNAILTVRGNGMVNMGKTLGQWFVVCLVISFGLALMVAGTIPAGADYMAVFHPVAIGGTMAYGFGGLAFSVWYGRPWSTWFKDLFGALVYGCVTAGMFGWRWPH